jgi:hypothetical protein
MHNPLKVLLTAVVAVGCWLASPSSSQAAWLLRITQGAATVTIDLDPGSTPLGGGFRFNSVNQTIGDYTVTGLASSTNQPGTSTAQLDLQSFNIVRNGTSNANPLVIEVTAHPFNSPPGSVNGLTMTTTQTANFSAAPMTSGQVTFQSFFNPGSLSFGTNQPSTAQSFTSTPGSAVVTEREVTSGQPNYTITNQITVNLGSLGPDGRLTGVNISTIITQTPAPAGVVLALTALPVFGAALRRRKAKVGSESGE